MSNCENLALPENFQELNEKYLECLGEALNINELGGLLISPYSDNEAIAQWENAQEHCAHLRPDYKRKFSFSTPEIMLSSLETWIASVLTCDRFHMVNHAYVQAYRESSELAGIPVKDDKSTIPEYLFEATYDCARDPVIRERTDQFENPVEDELWPSTLNIRMYFDGDQKELVKEWTTSATTYTWSAHTNKMFKNPSSLFRKEIPITNLLDDFEKKPVMCTVSLDKHSVEKGEEIEITISDFRDSKGEASREFNRILVRVDEGEILNGEKSEAGSEYRVFRLDEQPVTVKYRAPKKGSVNTDKITVYNSCEILPLNKSPLRTTKPDKQIASRELNLMYYAWTGNINIEITKRFNCMEEEETSELGLREVRANDEIRTVAGISVGFDDFDLATQSTNAGSMLRYASGNLTLNLTEDHNTKGYAEKTQCHNEGTGKWEWVSPGSWGTEHKTMTGQANLEIGMKNLNMLIVKDIGFNKSSEDKMKSQTQEAAQMMEIQRQLAEAGKNMDTRAIEELKEKMVKMVQGDQSSSSIPIKVVINILMGSKNYPVHTTYEKKVFNVCSGDFEENESRSETIEMPLALPLGAEMKGLYTRGDNGNDRIEASINDSKPYYVTLGSGKCPEGIIKITGNITLERHKE